MATYYVDTAVGNDSNAGTSAGSGNAWATIQKAANTAVAGDTVNVKASGNYNEGVQFNTNAGTAASPIKFVGYTTTVGDGGQVAIDGQGSRAYSIQTAGNGYVRMYNFIFTGGTGKCVENATSTASGWQFWNCRFTKGSGSPTNAFKINGGAISHSSFYRCQFDNMSGIGVFDSYPNGGFSKFFECKILNNGGNGITIFGYLSMWLRGCIISGNSGDGIAVGTWTNSLIIENCTIANNSGHGINNTGGNNLYALSIRNNIIANHTTAAKKGLNLASLSGTTNVDCDWNFYYNNTANTSGGLADGPNDVACASNPIPNAGSSNWMPASVVYGGVIQFNDGTNKGYLDPGALQHQDSGGGGGGLVVIPRHRSTIMKM